LPANKSFPKNSLACGLLLLLYGLMFALYFFLSRKGQLKRFSKNIFLIYGYRFYHR
jgi:hypothetical protein